MNIKVSRMNKKKTPLIKLKTFDVFMVSICKCSKKNKRNQLSSIINAGKEKLFYYLDVFTYLRKMQKIRHFIVHDSF